MNKLFYLPILLSGVIGYVHGYDDPSINEQELKRIWYDDTPNMGRYWHYMSFTINGVEFKGWRRWEGRWELIKDATSYKGKRVLDLGANVGLVSIFLKKYTDAMDVVAMESDPYHVATCKKIQKPFNINFPIFNLNLDTDQYEKVLGYKYDVAICLSLYKWVKEKKRLLNYLSHFSEVLYEGHEANEIEIARFKKIGFSYHKIIGKGNKGRYFILFSKMPV